MPAAPGAKSDMELSKFLNYTVRQKFFLEYSMADEQTGIIADIADRVAEGALPGGKCVGCGTPDAEFLSLHAICGRQREILHPTDQKRVLVAAALLILSFFLGGLPALVLVGAAVTFRMLTRKLRMITEGEDLIVPIPVSSCAQCKKATQGSTSENALVYLYQALFLLAAFLMFAALVLERLSWLWGAICCAGALALNLYLRHLEHCSPHGMKALVTRVPEYALLLQAYPKAEIWDDLPPSLLDASAHYCNKGDSESGSRA